jgi:hypothetical protein
MAEVKFYYGIEGKYANCIFDVNDELLELKNEIDKDGIRYLIFKPSLFVTVYEINGNIMSINPFMNLFEIIEKIFNENDSDDVLKHIFIEYFERLTVLQLSELYEIMSILNVNIHCIIMKYEENILEKMKRIINK